ncbi:MAG: OmpA family protein, partial [Bacteroidales bacterium]
DKLAQTLRRSNRHIEVKGHTDNVGGDEFNMNLSRDRAKAVVNYLVSKGVNPDKLTYSYYGMRRPLSDNDTEEGRAKNRRVEFTIKNN